MIVNKNETVVSRRRICFIVSIFNIADAFLRDHIEALSEHFDVYLVANFKEDDMIRVGMLKLSGYKSIHIERNINVVKDSIAVIELYRYFKKMEFYSVHSVSPKAGLVTSLAGFMAGIPNRIHIFTGQVWATKTGLLRYALMSIDRLISTLNTKIMVDGESQRLYLIEHKIIKIQNSILIGEGSIAGVNTKRFTPTKSVRDNIRKELNINDTQVVYIFLGRLNKDKGIDELLQAFNKLAEEDKNVYLLLIGVDEDNYISRLPEFSNIQNGINFHYFGKTTTPEETLQAGDIFCLPTYREGFGTSVIESSCLGLPVICSDTYGVIDAMVDDITGLRCKVKDVDSLYQQMKRLSNDPVLRKKLGLNGRERVLDKFSGKLITQQWVELYKNLN